MAGWPGGMPTSVSRDVMFPPRRDTKFEPHFLHPVNSRPAPNEPNDEARAVWVQANERALPATGSSLVLLR